MCNRDTRTEHLPSRAFRAKSRTASSPPSSCSKKEEKTNDEGLEMHKFPHRPGADLTDETGVQRPVIVIGEGIKAAVPDLIDLVEPPL